MHTTWLSGWSTAAVWLTVIVKVLVGPVQEVLPLLKVGVTTIVPVIGVVPPLVAVKDEISPLPVEARPMLGVVLVHAYVVVPPELVVPNVTRVVADPLHTT